MKKVGIADSFSQNFIDDLRSPLFIVILGTYIMPKAKKNYKRV